MVCRIGGFIVQRHNELHDLIGGTEITEPLMLGLILIHARGFWEKQRRVSNRFDSLLGALGIFTSVPEKTLKSHSSSLITIIQQSGDA